MKILYKLYSIGIANVEETDNHTTNIRNAISTLKNVEEKCFNIKLIFFYFNKQNIINNIL